jgi:Ni/Co efflux regulator RcnB
MKKLLAVLMSLSLLLPAISEAQNNSQPNRQGRPAAGAPNRSGGQTRHGGGPAGQARHGGRPAGQTRPQRPSRPQAGRPGGHGSRPAGGGTARHRPPTAGRPVRGANAPRPPRGNQFWHRGRYVNRVRGPAFVWPRGYSYRRWGIGGVLPAVFLTSPYFFTGWAGLGLQAPVPGYQWVRFGPDLLLVNLRTGQVEDVIYGAFF